jgi:hypothetical protein
MESQAHEGNNCFLVVTASSSNESDVKISIWKKHIHSTREIENELTTGWDILKTLFQVLIHLLAIGMIIVLLASQTVVSGII